MSISLVKQWRFINCTSRHDKLAARESHATLLYVLCGRTQSSNYTQYAVPKVPVLTHVSQLLVYRQPFIFQCVNMPWRNRRAKHILTACACNLQRLAVTIVPSHALDSRNTCCDVSRVSSYSDRSVENNISLARLVFGDGPNTTVSEYATAEKSDQRAKN
jgi:hypothetical protein